MTQIVFWQSMISPHQAGLVRALAARQGLSVSYVAAERVDPARAAMGWREPDLGAAELWLAETPDQIVDLAAQFGPDAVHLCQGFRGNGVISHALPALADKGARIGVMMEAVDMRGKTGWLKKPLYQRQIKRLGSAIDFCLAIGDEAGRFLTECGVPSERVFPFSYFLEPEPGCSPSATVPGRLVYVGKLIGLKRVDLLIEAFGALNRSGASLSIVGAGPLEDPLRSLAAAQPNAEAITWLGTLANEEAQQMIADSDALILPSDYDGWGAVVSEALLAGTPAICSSACGAAVAVDHSGAGGVFTAGDKPSLINRLHAHLSGAPRGADQRAGLRAWAQEALSAQAGAAYLAAIIASAGRNTPRPEAPWVAADRPENPQEIKTFVTR